MIRKQIYIGKDQDGMLKRAARSSGVSQAELIRRGIGKGIADIAELPVGNDLAWRKAMGVMNKRARNSGITGKKRTWKREDLYDR
jgi:hypothetical protein